MRRAKALICGAKGLIWSASAAFDRARLLSNRPTRLINTPEPGGKNGCGHDFVRRSGGPQVMVAQSSNHGTRLGEPDHLP